MGRKASSLLKRWAAWKAACEQADITDDLSAKPSVWVYYIGRALLYCAFVLPFAVLKTELKIAILSHKIAIRSLKICYLRFKTRYRLFRISQLERKIRDRWYA